MTDTVPAHIHDAPYNLTLAQEPNWQMVCQGLEVVFIERNMMKDNTTIYASCEFMDGKPRQLSICTEPSQTVKDYPTKLNSNIYEIFEEALCPTLAENPMHHAMFRYKDNQWQAARVFDPTKESWNVWRESVHQSKRDRQAWFEQCTDEGFEVILETNLYVMVDPTTGMQELVPLLIGVGKKTVWMMTSGFSNRLNPRSGKNWEELPTCDVELLYRCPRKQLGNAVASSVTMTKTKEVESITQIAEAFHKQHILNLKSKTNDDAIDLSKPQRFTTLDEIISKAEALEPSTPYILTAYEKRGKITLSDNREITPALLSIESALSSKINPTLTAMVKGVTGTLGKAPKTFSGPSKIDLITQLRQSIESHGRIKSHPLKMRMENYAGLEFYANRYLPEDLAPHLEYLNFYEFGPTHYGHLRRHLQDFPEFDANVHSSHLTQSPSLHDLKYYTGLKKLDLRSSKLNDLDWLGTVHWLEELLLNSAKIDDFSSIKLGRSLKRLDIGQTNLKSLSPILPLTQLENLDLYEIPIKDVSPLAALQNLKRLNLSHMPIKDISFLKELPELEEVLLAKIDITDFSALSGLENLKLLSVAQTGISDLSVIPTLPNLETLYIWDCIHVNDISTLERFPKLEPVNTKGTSVPG